MTQFSAKGKLKQAHGCTNFFRAKSPEAPGPRQGLQHAHTNARARVLRDTMQQGKRPYKISGVYKGQGPKSFWHSQKIEAESPVFCFAKKAHGKIWCTP
ncbi:MAG: hypothetical protein LBQ57_08360, partial [Spirochaetales bacterium]|nr:hypothetical protein [Spirochaetales bacterium]